MWQPDYKSSHRLGGYAFSESVYEQVEHKLSLGFEFLGEHLVKNIPKPVRVYLLNPATQTKKPGEANKKLIRNGKSLGGMAILAVAVVLAGLGWLLFRHAESPTPQPNPSLQSDTSARIATLAVLPFLDLSQEADQGRMGEGVAEDLITALSAIPRLSITSRTASFRFKDKPPDPKEIGRELSVKYLLEGSVQKEGEKFRVTAQLIDATTGLHIWADRFDLQGTDTFALKDEVTLRVMKSLQVQIGEREGFSVKPKQTESLEAYLRFLRGRSFASHFTPEKNAQARRFFQEALGLDPNFVDARLAILHTYLLDWWFGWNRAVQKPLDMAWNISEEILRLDPQNVNARGLQSHILSLMGRRLEAKELAKRLVEENPRSSEALGWMGVALYYNGKVDEGISFLEKAMRIGKTPAAWYLYHLGYAYLTTGRPDEAATIFQKVLERNETNPWALLGLVAAKGLGRNPNEAKELASKVVASHPGLDLDLFAARLPFHGEAQRQSFLAALHEAGIK